MNTFTLYAPVKDTVVRVLCEALAAQGHKPAKVVTQLSWEPDKLCTDLVVYAAHLSPARARALVQQTKKLGGKCLLLEGLDTREWPSFDIFLSQQPAPRATDPDRPPPPKREDVIAADGRLRVAVVSTFAGPVWTQSIEPTLIKKFEIVHRYDLSEMKRLKRWPSGIGAILAMMHSAPSGISFPDTLGVPLVFLAPTAKSTWNFRPIEVAGLMPDIKVVPVKGLMRPPEEAVDPEPTPEVTPEVEAPVVAAPTGEEPARVLALQGELALAREIEVEQQARIDALTRDLATREAELAAARAAHATQEEALQVAQREAHELVMLRTESAREVKNAQELRELAALQAKTLADHRKQIRELQADSAKVWKEKLVAEQAAADLRQAARNRHKVEHKDLGFYFDGTWEEIAKAMQAILIKQGNACKRLRAELATAQENLETEHDKLKSCAVASAEELAAVTQERNRLTAELEQLRENPPPCENCTKLRKQIALPCAACANLRKQLEGVTAAREEVQARLARSEEAHRTRPATLAAPERGLVDQLLAGWKLHGDEMLDATEFANLVVRALRAFTSKRSTG